MSLIPPSAFDWRPFVRIIARAYGLELTDAEIEAEAKRVVAQVAQACGQIEECLVTAERAQ